MREFIRDRDRAEPCLDGLCSVVTAAVVGAVGVVGGATIASKGAKDAAKTQVGAAKEANDTQLSIFNKQVELQEPWRTAGIGGLNQYAASLQPGADLSFIQNSPGYQFGLSQGVNAINQSAASRGLLNSGANLKNLNMFGQDYAGTKLAEYRNPLAALAGIGQTATNQIGAAGQNYANQFGNNLMSGAAGAANAQAGNGATWGNAFSQLGGIGANYLNNRYAPTGLPAYTGGTSGTGNGYSQSGYLNGLF